MFSVVLKGISFGALFSLLTLPAVAEVQVNDSSDILFTAYVPCANSGMGEIIELSGPLHTLITYTINNNSVSGKYQFQPQGLSSTGQVTGAKYQGTGVTQESFQASFQNGQANSTYINNFRMIGQGPGNNFLVHETLHINFNANGDLTVYHDNFSIECK